MTSRRTFIKKVGLMAGLSALGSSFSFPFPDKTKRPNILWIYIEDMNPLTGITPFGVESPPFPSNELPFDVKLQPGEAGKVFYSGKNYGF